jgi:hypothetical protein
MSDMSSGIEGRFGRGGRVSLFKFRASKFELKAKGPALQKSRDGDAGALISTVLGWAGYSPGPVIFNYPDREDQGAKFPGPDTILLLTTRPPLDIDPPRRRHRKPDEKIVDRKPIDRSGTRLEERVLDCCRRYLAYSSRSTIELTEGIADALKRSGKADLAYAQFSVFLGGSSLPASEAEPNRIPNPATIGYLIAAPAWEGGPRLLAAFGAGGTETLIWAYLLATKEFDLMNRAAGCECEMVVLGQFAFPGRDVNRVPDLSFADGITPALTICESGPQNQWTAKCR